jgi:cation diffusion facilitator CzcD-associated flavoprotein CzcO
MSLSTSARPAPPRPIRVAIVGAGFSGIAMALALKDAGYGQDMVIIDKADEFGGTWRDNRYPGCACDVPSHLYSLEGEQYDWPAFYSHQPAILQYILDVVAKHDLRRHARLGSGVATQRWDDATASWHLTLEDGETIEAEVVVNGVGPLSRPIIPDIPGIDGFTGPAFHSAQWDPDLDLTGKRVGIIGTGASAVQIVPSIVDQVGEMTVFQRTPSWVLPRVERTFSPAERFVLRNVPGAQKLVRNAVNTIVEHVVWRILAQDDAAQERARKMGMWNIRKGVKDPELRKALTPSIKPGCKRLMFSNTYYPALERDHVTVETDGIAEITPTGVRLADGREVDLDVIVFGTGFDPHHFWSPMEVIGQGGVTLDEQWSPAANAYNGTATPNFPNLFFLLGPNTGTGHNSVVLMAEAQARHVVDALAYLRSGAADWIAPTDAAADAFGREVSARHDHLVWASGCGSWYLNEAGINDTIYPGPVREFQRRMSRFDIAAYATGHRRTADQAVPAAV